MQNAGSDKIRVAFGTVLRRLRKERGWSQEELAHRSGIAMRFVSLLETNKRQPTISTLYSLSNALEITLTEFVSEIENTIK